MGLALDLHCGMEIPMAVLMAVAETMTVVVIGTVRALLGSHGRFLGENGTQRQAPSRP